MINLHILLFLIVLATLLAVCTPCVPRACPPGGKRSSNIVVHPPRKCPRCGPEGLGECYGRNLCCGPVIGCLTNDADTAVCVEEHRLSDICLQPSAISCAHGQGKCKRDGVCCLEGSCKIDLYCRLKNGFETEFMDDNSFLTDSNENL